MAVCGDGGFMMNSQELETAVRLRLNLVVLIIQDNAFGMIRWKQAVDKFPDFGMSFGNPTAGLHAVQLEINRSLYMDERRYQRAASFARLASEFEILADRLAEIPLEELRPYRAAAE